VDQQARSSGSIVEASGAADQSATIDIPSDGVYLIQVVSDGDWTVEVQQ
jgi:hypothetical protein